MRGILLILCCGGAGSSPAQELGPCTIETVAGGGRGSSLGDGGPASLARFGLLGGIAVAPDGDVYIADSGSNAVRELRPDGTIDAPSGWVRRIAPNGIIDELPRPTAAADGPPDVFALAVAPGDSLTTVGGSVSRLQGEAWSFNPDTVASEIQGYRGFARRASAVAYAPAGDLYFAERGDFFLPLGAHRIKRLTPDGDIQLIAGSPTPGFSGDGGPARSARFDDIVSLAIDPRGNLLIADKGNGRLRRINDVSTCNSAMLPQIALAGVVNGASFRGPTLAPGLIVSIFGVRLGPDELTVASPVTGSFPTSVGGVRVFVDGIVAPILFTSSNQLSAVVPFGTRQTIEADGSGWKFLGEPVPVEVVYDGVRSDPVYIPVAAAFPALFTLDASGSGQGAILNQDGSVNGRGNPAKSGSVITLFATGAGATEPASIDGVLATTPLPAPVSKVTVWISGSEVEVLYAGAAPGLVAGITQLNVRLDADTPEGSAEVLLEAGGFRSATVQVEVGASASEF